MADEDVKTKEKAVKAKKEPKPTRFAKGWDQETWARHLASLTVDKVPDGWLPMSEICKKANEAGIKTSRIVSAMGGDRAADEIWDQVFKVLYVGGRKYGSPEILTKGFELLNNPNYHAARRGRTKKEKAEGDEGKTKVKVTKGAPAGSDPWVAK